MYSVRSAIRIPVRKSGLQLILYICSLSLFIDTRPKQNIIEFWSPLRLILFCPLTLIHFLAILHRLQPKFYYMYYRHFAQYIHWLSSVINSDLRICPKLKTLNNFMAVKRSYVNSNYSTISNYTIYFSILFI